ncbi:BRO-N domain-containing protein [Lapidilactobacillus dextrinicus]|uniref:BRO-N domain-containing protein n=1 Tax=Lapidilactobacillus dextrinicus TaxID=51664 RepID=UPI003F20BD02
MKIEEWNDYKIRFVEVNGEWYGVAKDISSALGYRDANSMTKRIDNKHLVYAKMADMNQKYLVISEFGIYKAVFGSHKPDAEQFQTWVFTIIKQLRRAAGLEGFEIFKLLDKQHQKQAMSKLNRSINQPAKTDFIKANTIANKAIANKYGQEKMIPKKSMTPSMLVEREAILDETVNLMAIRDKYNLQFSVSEKIYSHA